MKEKTLSILGAEYKLKDEVSVADDAYLEKCNGYCDYTTRTIVICERTDDTEIKGWEYFHKTVIRHEIVHAFLFESGLDNNSVWGIQANESHPEQLVEWIAVQFPKMFKVFEAADAI